MDMVCVGFLIAFKCSPIEQPSPPVDVTFCDAYKPVYWSKKDTRDTTKQNDANNRVWTALKCGKQS